MPKPPLAGKRIWIVDDYKDLAESTRVLLETALGVSVKTFSNPGDAITEMEKIDTGNSQEPYPNLIITDWKFSPSELLPRYVGEKERRDQWEDDRKDIERGGEMIISAVKDRMARGVRIPMIVNTGSSIKDIHVPRFPGADLIVRHKIENASDLPRLVQETLERAQSIGARR